MRACEKVETTPLVKLILTDMNTDQETHHLVEPVIKYFTVKVLAEIAALTGFDLKLICPMVIKKSDEEAELQAVTRLLGQSLKITTHLREKCRRTPPVTRPATPDNIYLNLVAGKHLLI